MVDLPDAFLSYTRDDDRLLNRFISGFRIKLSDEVKLITGAPFTIFQDCETLQWGDNWANEIESAVTGTRFFIPIITPSFLVSEACRNELRMFLRVEARQKRKDLVLPVYLIGADLIDDPKLQATDDLAQVIASRQYADLRELRRRTMRSQLVGNAIDKLAQVIKKRLAKDRAAGPGPTRPPPRRDLPELPDFVAIPIHDRYDVLGKLKDNLARPGTVLAELHGDPGIGKTAVAVQLAHNAASDATATYLPARGYPAVCVSSVLERLTKAISDPQEQALVSERLQVPEVDSLTKLDEVLGRLGAARVLVIIDDAQDLLDGHGQLRDNGLVTMFEEIRRSPRHGVQILFVTTEAIRMRGLVRTRIVAGLPPPDFGHLLTDLEALSPVGLASLPARELQRVTGGRPRSAELIFGLRAGSPIPVPELLRTAADPAALDAALMDSLDPAQARVLRALAVYGRPVWPQAVIHLTGDPASDVQTILAELADRRIIRQRDGRHHLPATEADRLTAAMAPETLVDLRRRAAEYFEVAAPGTAARLADLADSFDAIDLHIAAGNPRHALTLIADLDERYLKEWGHSGALTPWLKRLVGELTDLAEQVRNAALLGRALVQQGELAEGIAMLYVAGQLNTRLGSTDNQLALLVQIGGYHLRAGQLRPARDRYGDALALAPPGHPMIAQAHVGLALCQTEIGDFDAAIDSISAARQILASRPVIDSNARLLGVRLLLSRAVVDLERGDHRCLDAVREAHEAAREARADVLEAECDELVARVWLFRNDLVRARESAEDAYRIAARVGSPDLCRTVGITLATMHLRRDDAEAALTAANVAARFTRTPLVAEALAVQGVAAFRMDRADDLAAHAFGEAERRAREMLREEPGWYRLHETHGLALAGLALLRHSTDEEQAVTAYATAIETDRNAAGAAHRRRELFTALTAGMPDDVLPHLRDLLK